MSLSSLANHRHQLAFPLDYPDLDAARRGAEEVCEWAGVLKVGLELFVREGPPAVELGRKLGCEVFLDLKLHDIPATVERAVRSAAALGVRYLTVHAGGGPAMLEASVRGAASEGGGLTLLAVTVLTSLDQKDLAALGLNETPEEHVVRLADLAWKAGARGFVCSVSELPILRQRFGSEAVLVTPGIRPSGSSGTDDQKRVGTPADAIRSGADLLVVGRPIRGASDPRSAARAVLTEIAEAHGAQTAP